MNLPSTSVIKELTRGLLFCLLLTNGVAGQSYMEYNVNQLKTLKEQFSISKEDKTKAEISNKISEIHYSNNEIDSSKKYASLAIELLKDKKESSEAYKILKAEAIENYGSALAFSNFSKAKDTLNYALKLWKETGDKSGMASSYFSLGFAYGLSNNTMTALDYYDKSLMLYKELKDKAKEADILYYISLEKRYLRNYGDALEYSLKSLKKAQEIEDTLSITRALLANSFNYLLSKNYTEALQEQEKALRLYELSKDSIGIATTYNDMGVTYKFADNLENALRYHKLALEIRKKIDPARVGISYNYIADVSRKQGKLKEALKFIKEGLPYSIKHGDNRFIIADYLLAGNIYLNLKEYSQAIANYDQAREISEKSNNDTYQSEALLGIGQTQKAAGDINSALASLKQADKLVASEDFYMRQLIYQELMEIFAEQNDYKNAYLFQAKFQTMSDSVSAATKAEKIATLTQELMYENKRAMQKASQDKQIALKESQIKTQKLIKNISIAGLLLILAFAIVFYIRFKEKRKLSLSLEKTIAELKTTQQQLIHSEKMASLGELTAGIAHEIQNPLNFVNNFSEVSNELIDEIQEERAKNVEKRNEELIAENLGDIKQNLEKINYHGKRADGIVKGMLQHSRASGDKKEPTDINALADEYLRLAYHGLRAKDKSFNATLITDFEDGLEKVNVIPQDLGRVVLNLLTNAFYAVNEKKQQNPTDYEPSVFIATKTVGKNLEIKVKDNGNGMPQHVVDKIFQPFFTTKPTGQGTGLGLSISYEIIKNHGGELKVNTKTGEFTEFEITIPITD